MRLPLTALDFRETPIVEKFQHQKSLWILFKYMSVWPMINIFSLQHIIKLIAIKQSIESR